MTLTRPGRPSIAVLMAVAATAVALISTAGDAGARGGGCPDNKLCIWKHEGFDGQRVKIGGSGVSNKLAREMNNHAHSVRNNLDTAAFLYEKKNANGDFICFDPDTEDQNLGLSGFQDRASSTRITNGNICPMKAPPKQRGGGQCPDNKLCVWADDSRAGQRVKIGGKGVSNKLAKKMNNQASSLSNSRDTKVYLYEKKNGKGDSRCFAPGFTDNTLGASGFNDVASSTKIANGEACAAPGRSR